MTLLRVTETEWARRCQEMTWENRGQEMSGEVGPPPRTDNGSGHSAIVQGQRRWYNGHLFKSFSEQKKMIFTSFYFGINIYVKNKRRIDLLLYFILKKLPLNILLKSIVSNSSRGSRISVPFNIANATHYSDPSLCVTNKQTRYRVFKEFREKTTYRVGSL